MYPFKNKKAFTLPELIISISISSIVMLLVMQIFVYTSTATRRYYNEHELFENARIAMNFMETQIRAADIIKLTTDADGKTLSYLDFYEIKNDKTEKEMLHSFRYYYKTTDQNYMRLAFGNNNTHQELAKDIKSIQMTEDNNLLTIVIQSNSFTSGDKKMEIKPIIIKRQLSLLGKSFSKSTERTNKN